MRNMNIIAGLLILAGVVLFSGCTTVYQADRIERLLNQSAIAAKRHADAGRMIEASQLATAVKLVDPEYPGLEEIAASASPIYTRPILGSNKAARYPVSRSAIARVLLYVPDRILDFLDIVSFDIHMGPGLLANVHATRAVQLGAGGRAVGGVGWHDQRSLGFQYQTEGGIEVLTFGAQGLSIGSVGTSGLRAAGGSIAGLHRPSNEIYQDYRDYWAIGASATYFIGADIDFHPVQLADFILGWSTYDFLNDDFARTKGLELSRGDENLLKQLNQVAQSKQSLTLYNNRAKPTQ